MTDHDERTAVGVQRILQLPRRSPGRGCWSARRAAAAAAPVRRTTRRPRSRAAVRHRTAHAPAAASPARPATGTAQAGASAAAARVGRNAARFSSTVRSGFEQVQPLRQIRDPPVATGDAPRIRPSSPPMMRSSVDLPAAVGPGQRDAFGSADREVDAIAVEEPPHLVHPHAVAQKRVRPAGTSVAGSSSVIEVVLACRAARLRRGGLSRPSPVPHGCRPIAADSCALRFIAARDDPRQSGVGALRAAVPARRAARSRACCICRFSRLTSCSALRNSSRRLPPRRTRSFPV